MEAAAARKAFDALDLERRGTIGIAQLQRLHEQLHGTTIPLQCVEIAVRAVCNGDAVRCDDFLAVLDHLQRRAALETAAHWGFSMLQSAFGTITLEQAFYIFKSLFGGRHSVPVWNSFVRLRSAAGGLAAVHWQEIQEALWSLRDLPEALLDSDDGGYDSPTGSEDIGPEAKELMQQLERQAAEQCIAVAKRKIEDCENEADETVLPRDRRASALRDGARAKLHRWEDGGIGSVLNDGNVQKEDLQYLSRTKSSPELAETVGILERKYASLRQLLLRSMAIERHGELAWEIMTEREQEEICEQLAAAEQPLRHRADPEVIKSVLASLPGTSAAAFSTTEGPTSLADLMGLFVVKEPLADVPGSVRKHADVAGARLAAAASATADDSTFGAVLLHLNDRERAEQWLLVFRWSAARKIGDTASLLSAYCQLSWQMLAVGQYDDFGAAALAAGLRERAPNAMADSRIRRQDRSRYEKLAAKVIKASGDDLLFGLTTAEDRLTTFSEVRELGSCVGKLELIDAILSTANERYVGEHQELLRLIQGPVFIATRQAPPPRSPLERASALAVLRGRRLRWLESAPLKKVAEEHRSILQEALATYYRDQKTKIALAGAESTERGLLQSAMAQLLEEQELECARLLDDLPDQDISELREIYTNQQRSLCNGHFDNIAAFTIGDMELVSIEQLISDQLQLKYDALRLRLVEYSLLAEFKVGWLGRSEPDRQQLLRQREAIYRKHVASGDLAAAERLLGEAALDFTVHQLLGESRAEFSVRLTRAVSSDGDSQPEPEKTPQQSNLEAALQNRMHAERTALLDTLRTGSADGTSLLKRLELESYLAAEAATDYLSAAYEVGLLERLLPAGVKRHPEDKDRVAKLAKVHFDNFQQRQHMGIKRFMKAFDTIALPIEDDAHAWLEVTAKVMIRKHADEQDQLLHMLTDNSLQDLCTVAVAMSKEEQQRRMVELQNKHRWLIVSSEAAHHENVNILEESAAIHWVMLRNVAIRREEARTDTELIVQIVIKLLELQHEELSALLIPNKVKSVADLMATYRDQVAARKWNVCKNVCVALTAYEGPCNDMELQRLLKEKYESLADKYVQTFVADHVSDWKNMAPEERSERIRQFRLQAEQLRVAGKSSELSALYHAYGMEPFEFVHIFGDNQFDFVRKLLASTREPTAGDTPQGSVVGLKEEPELHLVDGDVDLLAELERHRAEEWQYLSHMLQGVYGTYWGESGRLAEAARLRHQAAISKLLETVTESGHYCVLTDRIQTIVHLVPKEFNWRRYLLEGDWSRLLELGHELLLNLDERLNDGTAAKKYKPTAFEAVNDRRQILDSVYQLLLQRQNQEARMLHAILRGVTKEQLAVASKLSRSGRHLKLAVMRQAAACLLPSDVAKRDEYLRAAAALKLSPAGAEHHSTLSSVDEDASVASLLAELIEEQMHETALFLRAFNEQDDDEARSAQAKLVSQLRTGATPNAVKIMLRSGRLPRQREHELSDAVHSKYDVAQERLLLCALSAQLGSRWTEMTDLQRHDALGELRLTVKLHASKGETDALKDLIDSYLGPIGSLVPTTSSVMQCLDEWCKAEIQLRLQQLADSSAATEEKAEPEAEGRADMLWNEQLDLLRRERRLIGLEPGAVPCVALVRFLSVWVDSPEHLRHRVELARERARTLLSGVRTVSDWSDDGAVAPSEDDAAALLDALLDTVEKRHKDERELAVQLVNTSLTASVVAPIIPEADRLQRLADLAELRLRLLNALQLSTDAHSAILTEAAAHQCALRTANLSQGRPPAGVKSKEDASLELHATILAELVELQDNEKKNVTLAVASKAPHALGRMLMLYGTALTRRWNDNVATVLLPQTAAEQGAAAGTGDASAVTAAASRLAAELVAAVEGKFQAARDRLLLECMRLGKSDAEWLTMKDGDRQELLMMFHRQLRSLRDQGKHDAASASVEQLLRTVDRDAERLSKIIQAVRQELAAERGVAEQDVVEEDVRARINENQLSLATRRVEIYAALESRLESERARMLEVATDADAPLLLIWLRLEQWRVLLAASGRQWDEKSASAAAAAALALTAEQELNDVMTSFATGDKETQLEVARHELQELLHGNKGEAGFKDASAVPPLLRHARLLVSTLARGSNAREIFQEALIESVHRKHQAERKLFARLTQHVSENSEMLRQAEMLGLPKVQRALEKLETDMNAWRAANKDTLGSGRPLMASSREEQLTMLQKAALYRAMVEYYQQNDMPSDDVSSELLQSIFVLMLADVQACQASEERSVNDLLLSENDDTLEELVGLYTGAQLAPWADNVAAGMLHVLDESDKWVTEARRLRIEDEKYQAEKKHLLDQMIMHGLKTIEIDGEDVDAMEYLKKKEVERAIEKQAGMVEIQKQQGAIASRRASRIQERLALKEHSWVPSGAPLASQLAAERIESSAGSAASDAAKEDERKMRLAKMKEKIAERQFARSKTPLSERFGSAGRSRSASPTSQGHNRRDGVRSSGSRQNAEELLGRIVRDLSKVKEKEIAEEKKQLELFKKRRDNMQAQKENVAMNLLSLGERQKTTLEKSRQEDRSRQNTMLEERRSRTRTEKTITAKGASTPEKKFTDMVESTADAADRDQKMAVLAKELEQKLKAEERLMHHKEEKFEENDQFSQENALTDEERMRLIKDKRAMKRLKRRESFSHQ